MLGNAHISGTYNLVAVYKLFHSMGAPARYTRDSEKRSIELGRKLKHIIDESAVEIDVSGNAFINLFLFGYYLSRRRGFLYSL